MILFLRYMGRFLKGFPKWFGLYLALAGLITFNLFILEEAFQTCMFGSWPAVDVGEWQLVKKNLDTMEKLHSTLITMNTFGGWINPFAYISYNSYADAEQQYMKGLKAKVFANAPEIFEGEYMRFFFYPQEWEQLDNSWIGRNGPVAVLTNTQRDPGWYYGKVLVEGHRKVMIDCRKERQK